MGKMTYAEQLRHPLWQRKRLETMEAAGFACESCGDKSTTLHVHHKRYVKGRMVWEYDERELQTLCEPCHAQRHEHHELLDLLMLSGDASYPMVIGLLAGYLDCLMGLSEDAEPDARRIAGPYFIEGQMAALLGNCNWLRAGRAIASARIVNGTHDMNPAERCALEFLLSMPEPAKDM